MRLLVASGTSGGARPKASFQGDDGVWLAKFTSARDEHPIERVEIATLRLAAECGIKTPSVALDLSEPQHPIALIQRFDRDQGARIPYISARTALGKSGRDPGSYTEIAEFIHANSPDPAGDCHELYRRLLFTILVSNKDDHLKNHGFLYAGEGMWSLSPVFDVNPSPERAAHLETAIIEGGSHDRSIDLAIEASIFFGITEASATMIAEEMRQTITDRWRDQFKDVGLSGAKARQYELAFQNERTFGAIRKY
jgi:serine/threonine-protein kinase HipA